MGFYEISEQKNAKGGGCHTLLDFKGHFWSFISELSGKFRCALQSTVCLHSRIIGESYMQKHELKNLNHLLFFSYLHLDIKDFKSHVPSLEFLNNK